MSVQMGGIEGVEKRTSLTLTLHVDGGLRVCFTPRAQV